MSDNIDFDAVLESAKKLPRYFVYRCPHRNNGRTTWGSDTYGQQLEALSKLNICADKKKFRPALEMRNDPPDEKGEDYPMTGHARLWWDEPIGHVNFREVERDGPDGESWWLANDAFNL